MRSLTDMSHVSHLTRIVSLVLCCTFLNASRAIIRGATSEASVQQAINIVILSPASGSTLSGVVQVQGAAEHPLFSQYQLSYGADPNPANIWFPITGIIQNPVRNGLLGYWNTTLLQSGVYQLRLQVTLRDGSQITAGVNNLRIQNLPPTSIPTPTSAVPPPIASFTASPNS